MAFLSLLLSMLFYGFSITFMDIFYMLLRSMVNCMSSNPTSRVSLVSCRNAFTMVRTLHSIIHSTMSK
jgi:Na+/melibiose symporter-like transporter